MKKKLKLKKPVKITLFIIVILLSITILSKITTSFSMKNDTNIEENKLTTTKNNSNKKIEREDIDITNPEITNLYTYIPVYDTNEIVRNAYQSKEIKMSDLSNQYLLSFAFTKLKNSISKDDLINLPDGSFATLSGNFGFSSSKLNEKTMLYFNKKLTDESFSYEVGSDVDYENDIYYYRKNELSSLDLSVNVRNIKAAYTENNNLYIEDEYLYYTYETDEEFGTVETLYTSSDAKEAVNTLSFVKAGRTNAQISSYLLNEYKTNTKKYIHTFKKNSSGNYYWYSTKPLSD